MTAFMAECIGTAILAFVIFALTHPKNDTVENGFIPPLIGKYPTRYAIKFSET